MRPTAANRSPYVFINGPEEPKRGPRGGPDGMYSLYKYFQNK